MSVFKGLVIPLNLETKLSLPLVISDLPSAQIVLKPLTRDEIEKYFRLKIIDIETNKYQVHQTNDLDYFGDDNIGYFLHDARLQIFVSPKLDAFENNLLREKISFAMNCILGCSDEYASWLYSDPDFSTVHSKGEYRSYKTAVGVGDITQDHIDMMRKIIEYSPSDNIPEGKFNTIRALFNSATQQANARDVSCVLYFSVLEAVYVQDNTELGYKLSMRMAKKLNKDIAFVEKIRKLYKKRGNVIHGSQKGNLFLSSEHSDLEQLAKDSIVSYLTNPQSFTATAFDTHLLSN